MNMRGFLKWIGNQENQPLPLVSPQLTNAISLAQDVGSIHKPDGGWIAWLHCLSAFILFLTGWGYINSFGVYQTFYEQTILSNEPSSNVAWIGSIQAFFSVLLGIVAGPLYDCGFLRPLIVTGTALLVSGMLFTSFASSYWELMLAQGVMVGIGGGLLALPGLLTLSSHFRKRIALAQGVATSGSSVGGVVYPIMFNQLEPNVGLQWTTRIMALLATIALALPLACALKQQRKDAYRRMLDLSAWRELPYTLFALAIFFGFLGFYVPFCYVQQYSIDKLDMGEYLAFYLLAILNAGAFLGRIVPNILAHCLCTLNTLTSCVLISSLLVLVWISLRTNPSIIVFCVLYGFFSGPIISLSPSVVAGFCPDPDSYGTRMGMMFVPMALGYLIGNPIAGIVLGAGWVPLQVFSASALMLCAGVMLVIKVRLKGGRVSEGVDEFGLDF